MSLAVFPSDILGLDWDVKKTPISSTRVLTARSGLEYRAANWSYGKYKWSLSYSLLRQNRNGFNELQELLGFCLAQQGMFSTFAYSDPTDNSVTAQAIGIGNSTQTVFPLVRAFGGYVEPVLLANAISNVYLNGVNQTSGWTAYQSGRYGIDSIQFTTPPATGVAVTATFTYYFPVRFLQDDPEFNNFYYKFWSLQKLEFQSVK
jgi:uncharacterized protein (TIGR02217 family)